MKRRAAACCTAWPPATEPVKLTKSTRALVDRSAPVASWLRCRCWNTPAGSPAAANASPIRSAHSGVWAECFRITALPAINAGTTAFTAVR